MANIRINDNPTRQQFNFAGGAQTFQVNFPFFENTDLKVYRSLAINAGNQEDFDNILTYGTDYTVTGAGNADGGIITIDSSIVLNVGDIITIVNAMPIDRQSILNTNSAITRAQYNQDMNSVVLMCENLYTMLTQLTPHYYNSESVNDTPGVGNPFSKVNLPLLGLNDVWRGTADGISLFNISNIVVGGSSTSIDNSIAVWSGTAGDTIKDTNILINNFNFAPAVAGNVIGINDTSAFQLPVGTTAQQPAGSNGMIRYNSDDTHTEIFENGAWHEILNSSSGAPADAKYILQTTNSTLTNAQSLGALTTGIIKNTVTGTTGILSEAIPGTDYLSPSEIGVDVQAYDDTLEAISAISGYGSNTGMLAITDTTATGAVVRTITGTTNEITLTNGSGVSGNPTIAIATNPVLPGLARVGLPTGGTADRPGTPTDGDLRYNSDNNAFEGYQNGAWITFTDSSGTVTSLTQGTGIVLTPSPITSTGSIAVNTTLAALSAFNTNGIMVQTATDTFTARTIQGASNQIIVDNGNGITGDPLISFASSIDLTDIEVNNGSFVDPIIEVLDTQLTIENATDATKAVKFDCSGITTGTTRTLTIPDADGTILLSSGGATLSVASGGTGVSSFTPTYSVLCSGTTSAGNLQTVASVGTAGQVLTSSGAGALPIWADAAGGSGSSISIAVNQTAHGLSVGNAVYVDSSGDYTVAIATATATAEVVGIVTAVADTDNFTLTTAGEIDMTSASWNPGSFTPGDAWFLSTATAGELQSSEPASGGQISKPVFIANSASKGFLINYRGNVVNGAIGATSGMDFLGRATASGSATIDFANFLTSAYDCYLIVFSGVVPATSGSSLTMRVGTGSTPTWISGASSYAWNIFDHNIGGTTANYNSTADSSIALNGLNFINNAANYSISGQIYCYAPSNGSLYTQFTGKYMAAASGFTGYTCGEIGGVYLATTAVTSLRFLMASGNITSGHFKIYGLTS